MLRFHSRTVAGTQTRNRWIACLILAAVTGIYGPYAVAECLKAGSYSIIDGGTLEYQGERIRLQGVLAPNDDRTYADASAAALQQIIAVNCPIRCVCSDQHHDDCALAICYGKGGLDINAEMVRQGHALADRAEPPAYASEEAAAKAAGLGLWSEEEVTPAWIWPAR